MQSFFSSENPSISAVISTHSLTVEKVQSEGKIRFALYQSFSMSSLLRLSSLPSRPVYIRHAAWDMMVLAVWHSLVESL